MKIASAAAIFQMTIDKILQGLSGVSCYSNDILITAWYDAENLTIFQRVFERLERYGVHLKRNKCVNQQRLHKIDTNGLHTTSQNIEASTGPTS